MMFPSDLWGYVPWAIIAFFIYKTIRYRRLCKMAHEMGKAAVSEGRAPTIPTDFRYIGRVRHGLQQTLPDGTKKDVRFDTLYFMNDRGDRKVEHATKLDGAKQFLDSHQPEHLTWLAGGPFPQSFIADEDVLGEMLNRLIDAKLTGDNLTGDKPQ